MVVGAPSRTASHAKPLLRSRPCPRISSVCAALQDLGPVGAARTRRWCPAGSAGSPVEIPAGRLIPNIAENLVGIELREVGCTPEFLVGLPESRLLLRQAFKILHADQDGNRLS